MKKRLFVVLLLFAALMFTAHARAEVIVIANPSVRVADVSRRDLRDVFIGTASSVKDGSHLIPVLLRTGPTHSAFLAAYVGKSDMGFSASWRSLIFSGQASMPKTLDSEAAVVQFVAHNAGAVGYISSSTPHQGVKVLAVN